MPTRQTWRNLCKPDGEPQKTTSKKDIEKWTTSSKRVWIDVTLSKFSPKRQDRMKFGDIKPCYTSAKSANNDFQKFWLLGFFRSDTKGSGLIGYDAKRHVEGVWKGMYLLKSVHLKLWKLIWKAAPISSKSFQSFLLSGDFPGVVINLWFFAKNCFQSPLVIFFIFGEFCRSGLWFISTYPYPHRKSFPCDTVSLGVGS